MKNALAALPNVGEMARPASRGNEDHINPDVIASLRIKMRERICCCCDAAQAVGVNCHIKISRSSPRFNLDKGRRAPASCDQVNLAAAQLHPPRENPPAVQTQPPRCASLSPSTKTFRRLTIHTRGKAIARS